MSKPYDEQEKGFDRDLLIGFGSSSARKSYYPELQQRIVELEQAQLSLQQSEQRYRLAVEVSSDAIWDWDIARDIWMISTPWAKKLGLVPLDTPHQEALIEVRNLAQLWNERIHPDDLPVRQQILEEHLTGKSEAFAVEYRCLERKDRWIWLSAKGKVTFDPAGKPQRMIGSYSDITTRKQQEERIRHMAYHDALTDLPNRASLHEKMMEFISSDGTQERSGMILLLNIDNFKAVNDSLGYACGDSLLISVAERLSDELPEASMITRIGADEFCLLCLDMQPEHVSLWAERVLALFTRPVNACGNQFFITISIGIVVFSGEDSVDRILGNANTALQYAKKAGKKTWKVFKAEMQQDVVHRIQMESALHMALAVEQFTVYYQPQIDIASGRMVGMEALIRWVHPEKGYISPAEFIPLAEDTGMIVPLGEFVLRAACRFGNSLRRKADGELRLAVNISVHQLMQDDFIQRLQRILREENYPPELLELEITESILMESLEENVKKLKQLRQMGMHISLDDFGTGYSSLTYLSRLPIDVLKIDKSFVQEVGITEHGAAIIGTIIELAHQINMAVVAEGVETLAQLDSMRELNCDCLQGYLVSRPLSAQQFFDIYEENKGLFSLAGITAK